MAMGERLLAPGEDNPRGYWENERAVALHERLLRRLGRRWDDVRALPDGWSEGIAARRARQEIARFARDEFGSAAVWAVKDPRICRFLPLWLEMLPAAGVNPVVLLVAREPSEVAGSIARRNGWEPDVGYLLWLRHMLEAEMASRHVPRALITYEALLRDPDASMRAALERLDVEPPTADARLTDFVDARERHVHKNAVGTTVFGDIANSVYRALQDISVGRSSWEILESPRRAFETAWDRCAKTVDALGHMASAHAARADRLAVGMALLESNLRAQIEWSQEAVRRHDLLSAERDELRSMLAAQMRWSEEAVRKHETLQEECARLRSDLTAQIRWSEDAVRKHENLEEECARLRSDLTAQIRWSEDAVRKHETLQEEGARLRADLAAVRTECAALKQELARMTGSIYWRMTGPLRWIAGRFTGGVRRPRVRPGEE
ncbi:MAG TPA: hypothetical protein VEY50_11340 [Lysobacter sp.]|nr:hypothetical protein [Lysobacter sp.]